jgi:xylan 1,4-beta-xylosidase
MEKPIGEMYSVWAFGYDESNVTYDTLGKKLISELNDASPMPVYYRTHNLLNTDDGPRIALKWGSTNVYTEDEQGNPVYDWTVIDQIFDVYLQYGGKPNVTIAQMPKALTSGPEPYRHNWSPDPDNEAPFSNTVRTGYHYPPKDYEKWATLIHRWVSHCVVRYGREEVETWYWDVWDEPNLGHWFVGTHAEYFKLYDYTADAVKRALPTARVGGPASSTSGPDFLNDFLEHCEKGANAATGRKGAPLDYITIRTKGDPELVGDGNHVRMGMTREVKSLADAFRIISESSYRALPVIIGAADPDGSAAKSSQYFPSNAYRNGTLYPSYTASSFAKIFELADRYQIRLERVASWSFTFVDQPWFAGFRSLATNGVAKPILNIFRMYGMMQGNRVEVLSNNAVNVDEVIAEGVRHRADVQALASRQQNCAAVMVWHYHDDDLPAPDAAVSLQILGIPAEKALIHHFRIDEEHSNAYTAWQGMGSPQALSDEQFRQLESAGQLQLLHSPQWVEVHDGAIGEKFHLPRQGVSLLQIIW